MENHQQTDTGSFPTKIKSKETQNLRKNTCPKPTINKSKTANAILAPLCWLWTGICPMSKHQNHPSFNLQLINLFHKICKPFNRVKDIKKPAIFCGLPPETPSGYCPWLQAAIMIVSQSFLHLIKLKLLPQNGHYLLKCLDKSKGKLQHVQLQCFWIMEQSAKHIYFEFLKYST